MLSVYNTVELRYHVPCGSVKFGVLYPIASNMIVHHLLRYIVVHYNQVYIITESVIITKFYCSLNVVLSLVLCY